MRRALLSLALVLLAVVAFADIEVVHPPGGGGPVPGLPFPMEFGGTGSTQSGFTKDRCVEVYEFQAAGAGQPQILKLRASAQACAAPAPTPTPSVTATAPTPTPHLDADITTVGDCTSGAAFDGTCGSSLRFLDTATGHGLSFVLQAGSAFGERTVIMPGVDGTVVVSCKAPLVCTNGQVTAPTPTPSVTSTAPTPTPHLDADIESVGDCTSGPCFEDANNNTGTLFCYRSTSGTKRVCFSATLSISNRAIAIPDRDGTLAVAASAPLNLSADGLLTLATPTPTITATPTATLTATPTPTVTPDVSCTGGKITLTGHDPPGISADAITTSGAPGTAGRYVCSLIRAPCTVSAWTKMSGEIATGLASSVSEVGIFTADGATRLGSTGPQASTAATLISATGLNVTLTSGTQYLVCFAASSNVTIVYRALGALILLNNNYVNTAFASGTGATQVAPYNAACTGSTTPYTCCTGSGTGTCNGMADRTGVQGIAALSTTGPVVQLAP